MASCGIVQVASALPVENSWMRMASMPSLGRSYFGCIGVNGLVYAIGGGSSGLVPYNSVYDPESNGWATKQSMPSARLYFGIATWEGKIYCIGGQYGPVGTNEVYDVATDTWTTLAAMPTPRSYLCASAVDGKIY
jgi:N-acetylneuraminic acid mutarotase